MSNEENKRTSIKILDSMESFHPQILDMLKNHQPLIVLSSLSMVLASFIIPHDQAAALYAIAGSLVFLLALIFSIIQCIIKGPNIILYGMIYSGIILGFVFLFLTAFQLIKIFDSTIVSFAYDLITFIGIVTTFTIVTIMASEIYEKFYNMKSEPKSIKYKMASLSFFLCILSYTLYILSYSLSFAYEVKFNHNLGTMNIITNVSSAVFICTFYILIIFMVADHEKKQKTPENPEFDIIDDPEP
jgi:hypothetical protein